MKIFEFKKGDNITRVKPIIDPDGGFPDYSLVGKDLTFLGIANGTIYVSRELDFLSQLFMGIEKHTIQLPTDMWGEGWEFFVEPDFLDNQSPLISEEEQIRAQIQKASDNQEFEKADMLKKKLEEITKNKGNKK